VAAVAAVVEAVLVSAVAVVLVGGPTGGDDEVASVEPTSVAAVVEAVIVSAVEVVAVGGTRTPEVAGASFF